MSLKYDNFNLIGLKKRLILKFGDGDGPNLCRIKK